jgi:hypothetical protein
MLGVVQLPFQAFSRQVCGPEPLPQTLVRELDGTTVTSIGWSLSFIVRVACAQWRSGASAQLSGVEISTRLTSVGRFDNA